jgi:dynamin 1-like protein
MASLGEELLNVVNKLQDLVFNTIGNDSLDLPQIVGLHLSFFGALRRSLC